MSREISEAEFIQHEKNIEVYGYTLIKTIIPEGLVAELVNKVNSLHNSEKHVRPKGVPNRDAKDRVVYNLQNKGIIFIKLLMNPFIRRLLMSRLNDPFYRFLPESSPNYILNYYNARSSGNALDLHIDSHVPAITSFIWAMQVAFILEDQNLDNGCTIVVPGSHHSCRFSDRSIQDVKPIVSNPGDIVVWDSRLWHGTLENKINASRWSLIATFSSWWVKQSMDITRSLPDEIYKSLSDEEKSVLGFCSIPPLDESVRINTKCGYDCLKSSVSDFYT
jgi:ectoine hydroxylase-related dioxygenase (phytanoyl-CoA dioxygenase family)